MGALSEMKVTPSSEGAAVTPLSLVTLAAVFFKIFFFGVYVRCVHMCCTDVYTSVCMHVYMEARGWCPVSFSVILCLIQ